MAVIDALLPDSRRLPELQLNSVTNVLRQSKMPISNTPGVQRAELQIFFYYKDKAEGEVDFTIPAEVLEEVVRHRISVSISIMP